MEMAADPQLGQIVEILQGRESGSLAVIIRIEDERFVWIADGRKRKFDRPKKKNRIHLRLYDTINTEVANSLRETGRVTNAKLRFALTKFSQD